MQEESLFEIASKWLKLLLPFTKKGPYGVYALFGRLGAGLVAAGLLAWFPGVWEFLAEHVIQIASEELTPNPADQKSGFVNKGTVTLICMLGGLCLAFASLSGLIIAHNRDLTIKKTEVAALEAHENAIAMKILPNSGLQSFVEGVAAVYSFAVSFEQLDQSLCDLALVPGDIRGLNIDDFLAQVSLRTLPPDQVDWLKAGDKFYVAQEVVVSAG